MRCIQSASEADKQTASDANCNSPQQINTQSDRRVESPFDGIKWNIQWNISNLFSFISMQFHLCSLSEYEMRGRDRTIFKRDSFEFQYMVFVSTSIRFARNL